MSVELAAIEVCSVVSDPSAHAVLLMKTINTNAQKELSNFAISILLGGKGDGISILC
jgi:hypothetical protein